VASPGPRAALEDSVRRGLRAFMTRAVLLNHEVAEHTGLNPTDLQCLGLIQLHGPMSAGELARSTGLTASAITAVVDRLERSGFALREHDAADRRRIMIKLNEEQVESEIQPLYTSKAAGKAHAFARFSDQELATVRDFLQALEESAELEPAEHPSSDLMGPFRARRAYLR
jgi:DNA-binding MarR family transcriptional regulator